MGQTADYSGQQNLSTGTKNILTVLEYFDIAESENDIGSSNMALVFEISAVFISGKRKIVNFCICQM